MRSDRERLLDIVEATERIQRYAARGHDVFMRDELIQTWVVHHLVIIGEACRAVSLALQHAHPEVPWAQIVGMRNIVVHHYFGIDAQAVWQVVEKDLPPLKSKIEAILPHLC